MTVVHKVCLTADTPSFLWIVHKLTGRSSLFFCGIRYLHSYFSMVDC